MKKLLLVAAASALSAAAATPAAAYTLLFEGGQASPNAAEGFRTVADFANGSYSGFTTTDVRLTKVLSGNSGEGAAPANSRPFGTSYLSVLAGGNASYQFAGTGVTAFQFDWGSVDSYNTLTIRMVGSTGAMSEVVVPGSTVFPNPANGDQGASATNGRFTVLGTGGERFTGITLTSSGNSFEIDNLATGAVPEPATWGLMLLGFGMVGAGVRSRRRTVSFSAA